MFLEQLSQRHHVNTPLLPADVEQRGCPGVTLNRWFRWSVLYYTTDILKKLLPRTCENCRWGVSFIGKTGGKQCVRNGEAGGAELLFAASGHVCVIQLHSAGSRRFPCQTNTPVAGTQPAASLLNGIDLGYCKGSVVVFIQIVFILANPISFGIERIQI